MNLTPAGRHKEERGIQQKGMAGVFGVGRKRVAGLMREHALNARRSSTSVLCCDDGLETRPCGL